MTVISKHLLRVLALLAQTVAVSIAGNGELKSLTGLPSDAVLLNLTGIEISLSSNASPVSV